MLFCLDVGNSQTFGGVFEGGALRFTFRRTGSARASSDEWDFGKGRVRREPRRRRRQRHRLTGARRSA